MEAFVPSQKGSQMRTLEKEIHSITRRLLGHVAFITGAWPGDLSDGARGSLEAICDIIDEIEAIPSAFLQAETDKTTPA